MTDSRTHKAYHRVLLKISGEALAGAAGGGIDATTCGRIAADIRTARAAGVQVLVVIGGGNIFRGISGAARGLDRTTADHMGMLATVINALAMQAALEKLHVQTRVMSAIRMETICEPYIRRRAMRHIEKGRVVIFAAGTGNPFFTTDTAAALRASELGCDAIIKATKVDGVYAEDPAANPAARRYGALSWERVLSENLRVMDAAAVVLSRESAIPILVFDINAPNAFPEVVKGEGRYTIISASGEEN